MKKKTLFILILILTVTELIIAQTFNDSAGIEYKYENNNWLASYEKKINNRVSFKTWSKKSGYPNHSYSTANNSAVSERKNTGGEVGLVLKVRKKKRMYTVYLKFANDSIANISYMQEKYKCRKILFTLESKVIKTFQTNNPIEVRVIKSKKKKDVSRDYTLTRHNFNTFRKNFNYIVCDLTNEIMETKYRSQSLQDF